MYRIKQVIDRGLGMLLVVLMGLLVVDVLWQVVSRYVLGAPSSFTEELARFLLIWVGLLGGAYAAGRHMHLAVDLLPSALHGRSRAILDVLIYSLIVLFVVSVMIYGGIRLVWVTLYLGQQAAALQMPLGYVYLALPLSGLLLTFYTVIALLEAIKKITGRPESTAPSPPPSTR